MELPPDLRELLAVFNENGVEYVVVGSQAYSFHGRPRYTKDLDLLVRPDLENGIRIERALDEFGAKSLGHTAKDFENEDFFVIIGDEPGRVDLLTSILGVPFEQAWKNRVKAHLNGIPVAFLSLGDVIASKKAAGRLRDLADVEDLERMYELKGGRWIRRKKIAPRRMKPSP